MHEYKDWHKALSKELCEHMDCFEAHPDIENLCIIEKVAKAIVKLYEMEAYEIMFDCLEDCFGYDRDEHEFEDKDNGGADYVLYAVMNSYNPGRMTRGTQYHPTMNRGYDRGAMNGGRYGEYSTDRAMMYPYGEYEHGTRWMNAADGRGMRGGDGRSDGRSGGQSGSRDGSYQNNGRPYDDRYDDDMWMNAGRGDRQRRGSDGRYIMNKADVEKAKSMKPLDNKTIDEWMSDLVSETGEEGPMWDVDQTNALAKKIGVTFKGYTPKEFNAVVNMLYSDMSHALDANGQQTKPETYARLAKSWLEDVDSAVDGSKKLSLYYHDIVDADDDD